MEDSFKGVLITFALISILMLGVINFILLFPAEQGFVHTSKDNITYFTLNNTASTTIITNLTGIKTATDTGYDTWNIEIGYMGSNSQKSSKSVLTNYYSNVVSTFSVLAKEIFTVSDGSTNPISIVLGMLIVLGSVYITIVFIKWIRTGL